MQSIVRRILIVGKGLADLNGLAEKYAVTAER
jgi:hypothetical protein